MFFLKKLLPCFLFPVPLCAGFLLCGLVVWNFTRWKKTGRGLVVTGTFLILAFSYPWLPRLSLTRLESQYPRMTSGPDLSPPVSFIMVLCASGLSADTNRPAAARLSGESLQRIVEGVRLQRLFPDSTLLVSVSGTAVAKQEKEQVLGDLLLVFGMATNSVRVCATARDTEDELVWCKQVVTTNRVFLVSSASHLPRAMRLARRHGLDAVPSPSGYLVDTVTQSAFSPGRLFPNAGNLEDSERALHEYLGLLWEAVRGGSRENGDTESPKH